MITLYAFGTIFPEGVGETKDLWAQWALEEIGLTYRVHALDHTGGECVGEAFGRISPFRQVPVIDDDGFVVAESAAVLLYLAEKSGRLIPADAQGRTRVAQWCFAAVATVQPTFTMVDFLGIFDAQKAAPKLHAGVREVAERFLASVEQRLEGREWIACRDFTVADVLLNGVLRMVRKTDLLEPFPRTRAYRDRALARPAWQRTLALYAERLGTTVEAIR